MLTTSVTSKAQLKYIASRASKDTGEIRRTQVHMVFAKISSIPWLLHHSIRTSGSEIRLGQKSRDRAILE